MSRRYGNGCLSLRGCGPGHDLGLRALSPAGILVSVARGSVVDEAALLRCLREGELGGAGRMGPALWERDHMVLSPHAGSATRETRAAMSRLPSTTCSPNLRGRAPLTPIG